MRTELRAELFQSYSGLDDGQLTALCDAVRASKHIFIQGKGRMGMILKTFAIGLAPLVQVHVIGEASVPPIGPGDLLIVTPTGGDPRSSTRFLTVARESGARVAAFTANRAGPVGTMADLFIEAHARTMLPGDRTQSVQPMCSTLEQTGLLAFDTVVRMLREPDVALPALRASLMQTLQAAFLQVPDAELARLCTCVDTSRRIFFAARGAQLQLLSCYAMRLFHMGHEVHIAGDLITPPIGPGDLLIVSGSCADGSWPAFWTQEAARRGAHTLCFAPSSDVPELAAARVIRLSDGPSDWSAWKRAQLYGQCLLLTLDLAVTLQMRRAGLTEADMLCRHTNLE